MARFALIFALVLAIIPARAAPASDPVAMIEAIYKEYVAAQGTDHDAPNQTDRDVYSKRLRELIDADRKNTPEGEIGRLDFDVFVNGQDWELSGLHVALVKSDAQRTQVRATFINLKEPQDILFSFVREGGNWRIDEIQSLRGTRWTFSKILTGAPDAFPDEHKK